MDGEKRNSTCSEPFKATKIWNSLVDHLKFCLEPRKRRWKLQIYENCFRGCDVAEELQSYVFNHPELANDPSKVHVKSLCQFLLENRVIECVCVDLRKEAFENNRFYRFVNASNSDEAMADRVPGNSDLTKSCEKSERKKKRRSFEGWGLHLKSSRRKSYHGPIKRRDTLVCPSPVIMEACNEKENAINLDQGSRKRRLHFGMEDDVVETNPWVGQTPSCRKTKRQNDLIRNPTSESKQDDIPVNSFRDVWFEVALSNLLKLVDTPFLETILMPCEMESSLSATVYNNSYRELQTSLSGEDGAGNYGGRRGRDSVWQRAALECFAAQNKFPLPRQGCGFQNIMNLTEAEISNSLAEFYGSLSDSLISLNYSVLVIGILDMLKSKKMTAFRSLQLLLILVPQDQQEHLKRLLNYLEKSLNCQSGIPGKNRLRYICRNFADGILPIRAKEQSSVDALISMMIREHSKLFSIPSTIQHEVNKHIQSVQKGINEPAISMSACQRITPKEYEQQMRAATKEELRKLIISVIDDLGLRIRAKEHKLNQFRKHHGEIFIEQFPDGQI